MSIMSKYVKKNIQAFKGCRNLFTCCVYVSQFKGSGPSPVLKKSFQAFVLMTSRAKVFRFCIFIDLLIKYSRNI